MTSWQKIIWPVFFITVGSCALPAKKHIAEGNELARAGLYREAIESYQAALSKDPQNKAVLRNLGIVYVKIGNYSEGLTALRKIISAYPNDFDSHFFLGEAYRALENHAEAIFFYKRASTLKGKDASTLKSLAWSYYKARFYSEALKTIRQADKAAPLDVQVKIIQARIYLKIAKYKNAALVLKKAKKNSKGHDLAFIQSVEGDLYQKQGDYKKAFGLYQAALKSQPLLASALLGLAKCYLNDKDPKSAIKYLEQAVRIKPSMKEAYLNLGLAYEGIDKEKSLRYFSLFRNKASTDPDYLADLALARKKIKELKSQAL